MISGEKHQKALIALNKILVTLRWLVGQGDKEKEYLYKLLDWTEYLPLLIADPEDKTERFHQALRDLAENFPEFNRALAVFEED